MVAAKSASLYTHCRTRCACINLLFMHFQFPCDALTRTFFHTEPHVYSLKGDKGKVLSKYTSLPSLPGVSEGYKDLNNPVSSLPNPIFPVVFGFKKPIFAPCHSLSTENAPEKRNRNAVTNSFPVSR